MATKNHELCFIIKIPLCNSHQHPRPFLHESAELTSSLRASLMLLLSLMSCWDRFMTPMMPSLTGITRPHKMSIASVPKKSYRTHLKNVNYRRIDKFLCQIEMLNH